jgi:hypothetical protein
MRTQPRKMVLTSVAAKGTAIAVNPRSIRAAAQER